MDRITELLLNEFSTEHEILGLPEDKRFEHLASYISIRRQYAETFDTADVVTGSGGDTGIDAIAILVNGSLVTDLEEFIEQDDRSGALDVAFIFVQAERSPSFESAKIGQFQFGVLDFFKDKPALVRAETVTRAASIMSAVYQRSSKFKRGNPVCRLYYITTGRWQNDPNLEGRRTATIGDLEATNLFRDVEFFCIGADGIQKLYGQSKNALSREFTFADRTVVPEIKGVSESYLGFVPAKTFLSIVCDEDNDIIKSIFYDNVRDWQDYNEVNTEIKDTLRSADKSRFVLMNNGITIIARTIRPTGNRFYIEDFQVVNGCQTSHVLANSRDQIDDSVMIPLRLIGTQDEDVIGSIVHATNRQTEVKTEQFFAVTDFAKKIEIFFQSFSDGKKLYYERRSHQYDSLPIEKTRIVTPVALIKAFASTYLQEPHGATRNYGRLLERMGKDIFVADHKLDPYYVAAYLLYRLEYMFRSQRITSEYKPARYQILMAARLLANPDPLPRMNSRDMERHSKIILDKLWNPSDSEALLVNAAVAVHDVANQNLDSDNIRVVPFTEKLIEYCKANPLIFPD